MAKRPKRQYSREFTPRGEGRQFRISRIPAGFWDEVQEKARREGISLRALILTHLRTWVQQPSAARGER